MLTLVVRLSVLRSELAAFRRFEEAAARAMRTHGGRIERVVRIADDVDSQGASDVVREVHIVTFPDDAHFEAYRVDPAVAAVRAWRDVSVIATEVLRGEDITPYGAE